MQTAGFFRRYFSDVVDGIIVSIFMLVAIFSGCWMINMPMFSLSQMGVYIFVGLGLLYMFAAPLYSAFFESSKRQSTLGQRLLGVRICSLSYQRISFWHAAWRCVSGWVSIVIAAASCALIIQLLAIVCPSEMFVSWLRETGMPYFLMIVFLLTYYIRILSQRQQTIRDYLSRTLVIVARVQEMKKNTLEDTEGVCQ
jgi:uncharacterized RDD family membrane protein YckC